MKWDKQALSMETNSLPALTGGQLCCEDSYLDSYEVVK
jgi:hypothetical protein